MPDDWYTVVKFAYPTRNSIVEANQDFSSKGLRAVFTNQILGTEKAGSPISIARSRHSTARRSRRIRRQNRRADKA